MSRRIKNYRFSLDKTKNKKNQHKRIFDGKTRVEGIGAGDTFYIPNVFKSKREKDEIFSKLLEEIDFVQMFSYDGQKNDVEPICRMVSAQTSKDGKVSPIYRMPGCNQKNIETKQWTETVKKVVEKASKEISQDFNHAVLTLYRDENDSLGYHQDKLLDLDEDDSYILSISFGETRPIEFQELNGTKHDTVMLQPGSIIAIGQKTNMKYKHCIPKLNFPSGPRISLSIRNVKTYIEQKTEDEYKISGKGDEYQCQDYPYVKNMRNDYIITDVIKKKMEKYTSDANIKLDEIRKKHKDNLLIYEDKEC